MIHRFAILLSCVLLSGFLTGCVTDSASQPQPAISAQTPADQTAPAEPATAAANNGQLQENSLFSDAADTPDGVAGSYLASRAALQDANFARSAEYLQQALNKDPKNQSLIERVCVLYIMSGQIQKSLPLARQWQNNKPKSLLPSMVLFLDAAKRGRIAEADKILTGMETGGLNKLTLPLLRAWIEAGKGNSDAAIAAIKPLFAHETAGGIILIHAALLAEYNRDFAMAADFYNQAIARFTVTPLRLAMNLGNIYETTQEADKAKALYDAFTKRSPNNYIFDAAYARIDKSQTAPANVRTMQDGIAQVLFDIATSFEGQAGNDLAAVYAQLSAYMQPDFEFNQLLLSEIFESFEQYDAAAAIHEKLASHPAFGWSSGLRLARDYEKMNQESKAVGVLEKMRKAHPKRIEAVTMLGDLYRNKKDYAAAIEAYSEAMAASDGDKATDWPLYYARGTAFERAGLWPQAEKDLRQALSLSPDQPYVLNYLAYSFVEKGENLDEALAMLKKAVQLAPGDAFIIDSLGWALYRQGNYEEAAPILQQAVEARPYDPQLIDHYGDVLWQLNDREQAMVQWNRAMSFGPEPDLKKSLDQKLREGLKEQDIKKPEKPADKSASAN